MEIQKFQSTEDYIRLCESGIIRPIKEPVVYQGGPLNLAEIVKYFGQAVSAKGRYASLVGRSPVSH